MRRKLEQDAFSRRAASPPRRRRPGFVALALLLASVALMVLSRAEHAGLKQVRWQVAEAMAPMLAAAARPLEPIRWAAQTVMVRRDLIEENARLTHENNRLVGWEMRARELERQLASLSLLARVVEGSAIPFVTARVIADSSGPFVRAVMVSAGGENGLKPGSPVIGATGVVGRVVESGQRAARVLLLTDQASRIPVEIGRQQARAILAGDNTPEPRIQMLAPGAQVAAGDEVTTSGSGGYFPRGLLIGRVVPDGTGLRVLLHTRLDRLDYVTVLLVDQPALDVADETRLPVETPSRRAQIRPVE